MFQYFFSAPALRQIKKLPQDVQKRIIKKLDYYCQQNPLDYADFILDSRLGEYRFRIGDYRLIFDRESEDSILILRVGHRRDIYRKK